MSDKITLSSEKRTLEGKQAKQLRRKGILPANIFGKGFKSLSIQLPTLEFQKVYKQAGETHLIDLKVGNETHNVLVHRLQLDPATDSPLHVDFQAVSLKEKITATVPIQLVGESPAEKEKIGILVQQLSEVEVEALPTDLPDHLDADVSGLTQVDASLFVKDLRLDTAKVTIKPADLEKIVARVEPPAKEEVAEPVPVAEVSTEAETPTSAGSEAEEPAPKEEVKKE